MTDFDVRVAHPTDRLPISRMLELYQHDLSDIWDQDLDCHGEYGYALDKYWNTEGCYPFVVTANGKYAGFALVDQAVRIGTEGYWMDQFFVLKKYRRKRESVICWPGLCSPLCPAAGKSVKCRRIKRHRRSGAK